MDENWRAKYETLVLQLQNESGHGIYPQGHLTEEQRKSFKGSDAYKTGWNDACIADASGHRGIIARAEAGDNDLTMLLASDHCFLNDDGTISLNMNDTWAWALSWCPTVPTDQLEEVARLFRSYGFAGLMYWLSCREKNMRSEFHDNNRAIDFVRHEEDLLKQEPDYNKRAYKKIRYTLGDVPEIGQPEGSKPK